MQEGSKHRASAFLVGFEDVLGSGSCRLGVGVLGRKRVSRSYSLARSLSGACLGTLGCSGPITTFEPVRRIGRPCRIPALFDSLRRLVRGLQLLGPRRGSDRMQGESRRRV